MSRDNSTSTSLLRRAVLREPEAWQRMVVLYSPLVGHWCRQAGVGDQDIPDVSQEVFAAVASGLQRFQPERAGTSFRAWMRGVARNKLRDHFQHRGIAAAGGTDLQKKLREIPAPEAEFDLSERPDDLAGIYQRALDLVRDEFETHTWTAFWRVAIEARSPTEVAAELGMSPNAIRQAKSRVLRRLKEELAGLIE